ncbi:MAG TPA: phosphatase PAP2 family protein [Ktedonobacteraceae bacterium]|nr:phosphatase PAP2 family protein [Ktedonobacteraceae bacterium]
MDKTSSPQGTLPRNESGAAKAQRVMVRLRPIPVVLFIIGFIILVFSSVVVHSHPKPYPIDLQTTYAIQSTTLAPPITAFMNFISAINNPLPSIIALGVWLIGLCLIGLIARARGKSPVKWFEAAAGIIGTVGIASGVNYIFNVLVNRPRPGSFSGEHVHVLSHIPEKSFPSGHTDHDLAYYGFLLFLSFTLPVSQWKYRWILIPLQIYCVLDILFIGYSRILEGEHWLTDVLAGYLSGALWLLMCIFLYRQFTGWIELKLQARYQGGACPRPGQR